MCRRAIIFNSSFVIHRQLLSNMEKVKDQESLVNLKGTRLAWVPKIDSSKYYPWKSVHFEIGINYDFEKRLLLLENCFKMLDILSAYQLLPEIKKLTPCYFSWFSMLPLHTSFTFVKITTLPPWTSGRKQSLCISQAKPV